MDGGFLHKHLGPLGGLEVFYTSGWVTSGDWRFSTQAPGGQLGWLEVFYTSVVVATMCVDASGRTPYGRGISRRQAAI